MKMLRAAAKAELTKSVRVPSFLVPTVFFPIMFFALFGLPNAKNSIGAISVATYLMASYAAYAMMTTALFSFGVSIASERALGWNRLLRVTPLSGFSYIGAKLLNAFAVGGLAIVCLFIFAVATAHVSLAPTVWLKLSTVLIVGMAPFVLLGLTIGYSVGPAAAAPIANLISLPLAFGSGLFIPMQMLPPVVQRVAPFLPSYHLGQLGWNALGSGDMQGLAPHLAWIAGYTAAFGLLAVVAYRRDEGKQFG